MKKLIILALFGLVASAATAQADARFSAHSGPSCGARDKGRHSGYRRSSAQRDPFLAAADFDRNGWISPWERREYNRREVVLARKLAKKRAAAARARKLEARRKAARARAWERRAKHRQHAHRH